MAELHRELKRELSLFDVFAISSGAMISSGLFILPGLAFSKAGPAVLYSYLLAGLLVMPSMLAKAELATAMPRAGGVYFFIERSMGAPAGTLGGFTSWFSLSFKSAFALVGMGMFARLIHPGVTTVHVKLVAVGCCLVFMIVNILGAKHTGRFQLVLVLSLIGILVLYVARGAAFVNPMKYVPFAPHGWRAVFATAGLVFVSFGGLTKVCCVSEEVRSPGKNIPGGMFLALASVMILYAAVVFVTIGLLDSSELSGSVTPISLGASTFMGKVGSVVLAVAALLAFVTTANAGILTASRDVMAMSRDHILPAVLRKVSNTFKTPYVGIIVTTAFMIAVILFLSLENLVKTASTLKILLFLMVNLSLLVMRESRIHSYRPAFKAPFYPWIYVAAVLVYGILIFQMGRVPLFACAIFIAGAGAWYLFYGRSRIRRQAALIHVMERATSRELTGGTLPEELRDIVFERDSIVEDRFDQMIRSSPVLDIQGQLDFEEFARIVSERMSADLSMDAEALKDKLLKRETESSTVIGEAIAIPHIVVEGEHKFSIVPARSRKGIYFSEAHPRIHIVFVLAGTRDERNFHLRALSAIAQIVQRPHFFDRWMRARGEDALRDVILLGERKRHA
jgi:amino acid transporter/mannitol/fructose-specific phosphotransferase system IIA component (Ntr-type)